jgi:nitroreductase
MDTLQAIKTRRSIRRYVPEPIPAETVQELLTAAMSGPSTGNQQPWQFVVVNERARLDALAAIGPYKATMSLAPLAVVVCCDMQLQKWGEYWVVDCSIATQNLLLAAHALGLGAVWLGCHFIEERAKPVSAALGLPAHIVPFAVVPIGKPAQQIGPVERYKPDRIHWNGW